MGRQIQVFLTRLDAEELFEREFRPIGAVIVPSFAGRVDESYDHVADFRANCEELGFLIARRDMLPNIIRRQIPSGLLVANANESPLVESGPSGDWDGRLHRTRMYFDPKARGNPAARSDALAEFPAWAESLFRRARKVLEKRKFGPMTCYLGRGALEFERQGGILVMN